MPGSRGYYETQGFWGLEHQEMAHITILELMTVRLALEEFVLHCHLRHGEVVKLFTDNMVVMYVIRAMVSKSPLLMAELRRLHELLLRTGLNLEMHHLPSALNLYADRLSRRRRYRDYIPELPGVPSHWWLGDSAHDFSLNWGSVDLLRPPLEFLPLVPRKVANDNFEGLLLIPRWPRQNWHQALVSKALQVSILRPHREQRGKRWAASLLAFSGKAMRRANALLKRQPSSLNDYGLLHPREVEPAVDWRRELH